ncbi:MAG: metal ABC transporter ATP-binding protein [Desulfovibrio aminophilus]|jgi:zinc transport system ATP-binding protein|uniref:metal ABC transporter ATP-binding protein n=1 Tax=Desulfovibrio aminophilus TaxID=81425 RepID=UPI0009FE2C5A|nr:ABC transporter ATP-binding protein [Desulfovibrio aminophilus]MDY0307344.1 ABC transporter ATP-binding protein [Desulfovibrionaceae bacterium]
MKTIFCAWPAASERPCAEGEVDVTAIELRGISFSYDGSPVLENVDLSVPEGDFLVLLGPNGGGKSTLLKLVLGLLAPASGSISVLGLPPGQAGARIGYLPQYTQISRAFPITVLDAVTLGLVRPGLNGVRGLLPRREDRRKALLALERVGLTDQAGRQISALSGGQKQRALIARALVDQPSLLLLDEPTASVDPRARDDLFRLLLQLNRDMTIVMVSHDVSVLTRGVKSVACVNRALHSHAAPALTPEMLRMTYGGDEAAGCPVDLVTHGRGARCTLGGIPIKEDS